MNRYFMIRRLRGPVFLLLIGTMFLLRQMHVLRIGQSWPLILIFFGVFLLAERAALAGEDLYPPMPYAGAPGSGAAGSGAQPNPGDTAAIVPSHNSGFGNGGSEHEGGER